MAWLTLWRGGAARLSSPRGRSHNSLVAWPSSARGQGGMPQVEEQAFTTAVPGPTLHVGRGRRRLIDGQHNSGCARSNFTGGQGSPQVD